jgi:hypothetical protein
MKSSPLGDQRPIGKNPVASQGVIARLACKSALTLTALFAFMMPAGAGIIYDYNQAWLFDSTSGLYWQSLQVPTSTFIPGTGTIATVQQLVDLGPDAGVGSLFTQGPQQASYSHPLADLLSFFEAGTPAPSRPRPPYFSLNAIFDEGQTSPSPDHYQFAYLSYQSQNTAQTSWLYEGDSTLGPYGPGVACPDAPTGGTCPTTELALVVSTTPPVPLPASLWLLLSGLVASFPWLVSHRRSLTIAQAAIY